MEPARDDFRPRGKAVSKQLLVAILMASFGGWLMVHCPLAGIREFKGGVAKGLDPVSHHPRDFARHRQPIGFGLTIVGNFVAGLIGFLFFLAGIAVILGADR
jgi:hypothetical protein